MREGRGGREGEEIVRERGKGEEGGRRESEGKGEEGGREKRE